MTLVQCPRCGAGNPETKRFCGDCGGALAATCPACGSPVEPGKRFCGDCGAGLTAAGEPAERSVPVAERRVTSVLFADLVGFTPLSASRDAEEVRELLSQYFTTARTVISRYGGTVEKFIGDAVMAVWGVPTAHEDDAERAVRAGLDLTTAVTALGEQLGAPGLAMRVGIVTGEVAVTLGAPHEGMVAGDTVNTAARVQSVADPSAVWVDEATRVLSSAAVSYVDVGEHTLKGKVEPVRLYAARAVVAAVGGAQRVDGLEAPFTGRDRELRLVKELFHATTEERRPRLVAVTGAAGVGKSRLGWEFEKYVDGIAELTRWHRGRALSYGDGVAFWALAEMVRSRLGIVEGDPPSVVRDKLDTGLEALTADRAERDWLRPRLATLLGVEAARTDSAAYAREDLFGAWTTFFDRVGMGGERCVVLVFEDMQYADAGLLDFLDHLLATARFPLFVLTLARPELADTRPGWGSGRRATAIYLEPLGERALGALIDGLVEGLPVAAHKALVDRAEGIPLYAVETVRALIDRDAVVPRDGRYVLAEDADEPVNLATLGAPASLQALIAARLDALSADERRMVQDASVLGALFPRDALGAISPLPDIGPVLASLVRKELLAQHGDRFSPGQGQYRFVQALVRTVAYDTLSRRERKARHLAVADYLSSDAGDELAAVLARHYLDALDAGPSDDDAAELNARALDLLERAARRAESLGSPEEALRHSRAALDRTPEPEARARLLEGAARVAQLADQSEEAARLGAEARAAYTDLGRPYDAGRVVALIGLALANRGRLQDSIDLMTPTYDELAPDPAATQTVLALAEQLARSHVFLSQPEPARRYAEHALQLAEAQQAWDRVVILLSRYAVIWMGAGVPTGGMALLRAAVELARQRHLPHAMITPLINVASFSNTRDLPTAINAAREAKELAMQVGARDLVPWTVNNLGIALLTSGSWDEVAALYAENEAMVSSERQVLGAACRRVLLLMIGAARGEQVPAGANPAEAAASDDSQIRFYGFLGDALEATAAGRAAEANRLASEAADLAVATFGIEDDFHLVWAPAVDCALAVGDLAGADRLLALVTEAPPGLVSRYVHAHLLRLRALVAAAHGDLGTVDRDLAEAAVEFREFGAQFYLARTLLERAERLEPDAARPLVAEARDIFAGLQATPWLERASHAAMAGA